MSDYIGRQVAFPLVALDEERDRGRIVDVLRSPVSGEVDRVVVRLAPMSPSRTIETVAFVVRLECLIFLDKLFPLDPMAPDYDALGAAVPMSQYGDSRDAAGAE